jgi:hypothetical protein
MEHFGVWYWAEPSYAVFNPGDASNHAWEPNPEQPGGYRRVEPRNTLPQRPYSDDYAQPVFVLDGIAVGYVCRSKR